MKRSDWFAMGLILSMIVGCENGSKFEHLVEKELSSGQRNDSLFLNFYFGITREEFFSRGWEQNKQGLIAQGPRNQNIKYIMPNKEKGNSPIQMLFYPVFDDQNKIKTMNLTFNYSGWSPWGRKYFSDSLAIALQDTLERWYGGNEFVLMPVEEKEVWVKLDGNRLISLTIEDEQYVRGFIKDLTHPENKIQ